MKCDQAIAGMPLASYGELPDGERHELETHLAECPSCAGEWAAMQQLNTLLTPPRTAAQAAHLREQEEQLLIRFRAGLSAALEHEEQEAPSSFHPAQKRPPFPVSPRWWPWLSGWKLLAAPLLSLLLLGAGFAGGWLTRGPASSPEPSTPPALARSPSAAPPAVQPADRSLQTLPDPNTLVRVDSVERGADGAIQIHFDTVEQHSISGSQNDPRVRQMLLYAVQHPPNSGIRLDSLDVLGAQADNRQVRQVLIRVLRNDPNPGVRLKALESLRPLVASDRAVRQAVMRTVLQDASSGVRSQAVSALSQAPPSEAAPLLRQAGNQTGDLYLRLRIAAALQQMQEGVPARWLRTTAPPAVTSQ